MDNSELKNQDLSAKKSPFDDLSRDDLITKCKGLLVIAQKAKQAKSDLQNEVSNYKTQLEKCERDKKIKEDNVQTLQELVDSLTEQKLSFITEIDAAHSKLRVLNTKCNQYEEDISKQKAEIILKEKNLSIASQKLSDIDSELISLKRQNKRLLDENEQLITQLTELEARIEEFNAIGLQQREHLKILEEKVKQDEAYQTKIEELKNKIVELESGLAENPQVINESQSQELKNKIIELTNLYESEKSKKEKAHIKLRSYKDKILKCANCINQLKNSRFILTKTVQEYSQNIPKWQNEIIKASRVLENQMTELNHENIQLKDKLHNQVKEFNEISSSQYILNEQVIKLKDDINILNSQLIDLKQQLAESNNYNMKLQVEIADLKSKEITTDILKEKIEENNKLQDKYNELQKQLASVIEKSKQLEDNVEKLKNENFKLNKSLEANDNFEEVQQKMILQLKALESEKAILVKEKQNAKDNVMNLENQNLSLSDQITKMKSEIQNLKIRVEDLTSENENNNQKYKAEKDSFKNQLKNETVAFNEKYGKLKKEYDNLFDLNGLLQEEVETLKLSLEQPKDDTENMSELNVSLQADIVKLETKLAAYKQENVSLLSEVKESRNKVKEFDNLVGEYEEAKSKLTNYKTENAELLNEMKEINQVLKERGEAISKLEKAISEMERLIESLEKDRDSIKEERDSLLKKNETLQSDLKNAVQNTSQNNEVTDRILAERDNAIKGLQEKEAIISSLKEDLEKLKQQASGTVELPNEDMSTSTISRAEDHTRMRELDDTFEDKYTKLRMFALKLKKKLNETTSQLQTSEQEKTKLKKLLSENSTNTKEQQVQEDVVDSPQVIEKEFNKSEVTDLENKVKVLTADLEASEKISAKVKELEAELETKTQLITAELEAHKSTRAQLEKALKDVKKKNVLSLEMEDYERSMKELTTKMEENKKKIIQMESTIDTQEGTITAMKTQIKLLEEQIKTEETQNRLLKEELQQAIEDGKEKDNVINQKKDIITKLMQDLEDEKRKNEEADLEMTAALSEKEKIITNFGEEKLELNNKMKKLEMKYADLNEKLRITNIELADLKTEYTSYKVRAQAVLRQNQTVDKSQEEQLKEESAALKIQVETLTQKLTSLQEQYKELSTEAESGRKRLAEAGAEASRAHQRTARLQADIARLSQQLDSERSQHKIQVTTLTQCYKSQIGDLESKLQKETENLKKQITLLQDNIKAGKSDEESNRSKYMLPVIPKEEGSDSELDINVSLIPREEGEGSEAAPSPPLSKSFLSTGRRSPVPLERLLEEGVPENDSLDTSSLALTSDQEIADLRRKVQDQQQRVKHVTVLLAESERECARLGQLSELLKGELRRVRASAHNAHNTEYMKNVTLKFLTLPPGDERSRLVPVLQKILTLSSDETYKITAIAKGQDPNPSKGWGSYLPWPGGK